MIKNGQEIPQNKEEVLKKLNLESDQLRMEIGTYTSGENDIVDYVIWNDGTPDDIKETPHVVLDGKTLEPEPKTLEEAKGLVTADYQTYLEEKWIEELRDKYDITINWDLLNE